VREARGNDYRFSSLVNGIVKSMPFQMRRVGEQSAVPKVTASHRSRVLRP